MSMSSRTLPSCQHVLAPTRAEHCQASHAKPCRRRDRAAQHLRYSHPPRLLQCSSLTCRPPPRQAPRRGASSRSHRQVSPDSSLPPHASCGSVAACLRPRSTAPWTPMSSTASIQPLSARSQSRPVDLRPIHPSAAGTRPTACCGCQHPSFSGVVVAVVYVRLRDVRMPSCNA